MNLNEHKLTVLGVECRMYARHKYADGLWSNQTLMASREFKAAGKLWRLTVEMRFDDTPRNYHETFAITGQLDQWDGWRFREYSGGCLHEDIAKRFPEFAPLIKWHLTSIDGPMHYLANTVYHASDRDHNGLRKGETRQIRNGRTGELAWIMEGEQTRYHDGDAPPDETVTLTWQPWNRIGEGKERQLDYARNAAVWPDATDAELMQEPEALKAALTARLPALMAEFKAAMLSCGFDYPEPRS